MKKIIFVTFISIILSVLKSGCTGYEPIYATSNYKFKIEEHTIKGDIKLLNSIYRKLNNISLSNKNNPKARSIELSIGTTKERKPTVKDGSGNILNNQLTHVIDPVNYNGEDLVTQNSGNYTYDEIGQLTSDKQEEIKEITRTRKICFIN